MKKVLWDCELIGFVPILSETGNKHTLGELLNFVFTVKYRCQTSHSLTKRIYELKFYLHE